MCCFFYSLCPLCLCVSGFLFLSGSQLPAPCIQLISRGNLRLYNVVTPRSFVAQPGINKQIFLANKGVL